MSRHSPFVVGGSWLGVLIAMTLAGCGGRTAPETTPPATPKTAAAPSTAGDNGNPLGRWAWIKEGPSANDLSEADRIDEARQQFDDGLYDQAQQSVSALLGKGCTHPLLYYVQAQLHAQRSQYTEAAAWCDRAIAASPWWVEPRILLAQSYIKLQRLAAAESVFSDIDRLAPHSAWGPYGEGAIALMRGDRPRAVTLLDEALRREPRHLASLKARIDLANWQKESDLEAQLLDRYLGEVPDAAWAHARLGELALADNRLEDARRSLTRAYDLAPEQSLAQQLAELAQRRGDTAEAHRWQARAGTAEAPPAP